MVNKSNGRDKDEAGKIVKFPGKAQRNQRQEHLQKEQKRIEDAMRQAYQAQNQTNHRPLFNVHHIGPFTRFMMLAYILPFILLEFILPFEYKAWALSHFAFVPAYFSAAFTGGGAEGIPWSAPFGLISHVFLHGGFMHLVMNAMMTLVFGTMLEKHIGTKSTAIFYMLCAIGGAALHFILDPMSGVPVIGASSAIRGLFAAAIFVMYAQGALGPRVAGMRQQGQGPWRIIMLWAGIMTVIGLITPGNIAWLAHLGGYFTGALLYDGIRKGKIKL